LKTKTCKKDIFQLKNVQNENKLKPLSGHLLVFTKCLLLTV